MDDFRPYIRASYDIVKSVTPNIDPVLPETLESYLVHLLARNFRNTTICDTPIAIKFMTSLHEHGFMRKQQMADIGDECLFIYGFGYRQNKWPSKSYYCDMGTMAYGHASIAVSNDPLYDYLEHNFSLLSKVLNQVKQLSN